MRDAILELLAPSVCPGCDVPRHSGAPLLCRLCEARLSALWELGGVPTALAYEDMGARLIQRFKFDRRQDALTVLLEPLVERAQSLCAPSPVDCIVPIPRHRRRVRELDGDPLSHAEMFAIRQAAHRVGDWRLEECVLYVTLEPCPMCAGAIVLGRIPRVVFGVRDPKAGAAGSLMNLLQNDRLNHQTEIIEGVLAEECGLILQDFFREIRKRGPRHSKQLL